MTDHPITPSPELVTSLRNSAPHGIRDAGVTRELWLINSAYADGADQELEECIKWTAANFGELPGQNLHLYRRPKPPRLAERALNAVISGFDPEGVVIEALNRLAELEAQQ